jgi:hypothetical protein
MEEKFVNNLVKKVKYAGFGDSKDLEIRTRIANNEPSFQIKFNPEFKHPCEAIVNIKKDDVKDDYYFNNYNITVSKEGAAPLKQTIYTELPKADTQGNFVNSTITLKEAYNMMDMDAKGFGRSVLKDYVDDKGIRSQSWVRFDFTRKTEKGNYPLVKTPSFDLDAKLAASDIKGMQDPELRKQLRERLEKGNEANVKDVFGETEALKGIVVNPQFKNFKFVTPSIASEPKQSQGNSASQTTAKENSQSNDSTKSYDQSNKNKAKQSFRRPKKGKSVA